MNKSIDNKSLEHIAHALWLDKFDEKAIPQELLTKIFSEKNSNKAVSDKFKKYIEYLRKNKTRFIKMHKKHYDFLLENSDNLSIEQYHYRLMFLGSNSLVGYEPIPSNLELKFPESYAIETKYQQVGQTFSGIIQTTDSNPYSININITQHNMLPPELAKSLNISVIDNIIIEMIFSIVDIKNKKNYESDVLFLSGMCGLVSIDNKPNFKYSYGKNSIESYSNDRNMMPIRLKLKGYNSSNSECYKSIEINISLINELEPFLNGDKGHDATACGVGVISYSLLKLKLDDKAENFIKIDDNKFLLASANMGYNRSNFLGVLPLSSSYSPILRALALLRKEPFHGVIYADLFLHDADKNRIVLGTLTNLYDIRSFTDEIKFDFNGILINRNTSIKIGGIANPRNWKDICSNINKDNYFSYPKEFKLTILNANVPLNLENLHLIKVSEYYKNGHKVARAHIFYQSVEVIDNYSNSIGYGTIGFFGLYKNDLAVLIDCGLPANSKALKIIKRPSLSIFYKIYLLIFLAINIKQLIRELKNIRGA